MNTKVTPENLRKVLTVGTMLSVPGRKTPVRVVNITEVENGIVATTTSGRVRPGHRKGGALCLFEGKNGTHFYWQATLQQQAVHDPEVEIVGVAN